MPYAAVQTVAWRGVEFASFVHISIMFGSYVKYIREVLRRLLPKDERGARSIYFTQVSICLGHRRRTAETRLKQPGRGRTTTLRGEGQLAKAERPLAAGAPLPPRDNIATDGFWEHIMATR